MGAHPTHWCRGTAKEMNGRTLGTIRRDENCAPHFLLLSAYEDTGPVDKAAHLVESPLYVFSRIFYQLIVTALPFRLQLCRKPGIEMLSIFGESPDRPYDRTVSLVAEVAADEKSLTSVEGGKISLRECGLHTIIAKQKTRIIQSAMRTLNPLLRVDLCHNRMPSSRANCAS